MFGQMMVEPVVRVDPTVDLHTAVATLIKVTENVEIVRWIELPASVLLFLLVPGDPESGAVYVLDRKKGTWYAVDFEVDQLPCIASRSRRQISLNSLNGSSVPFMPFARISSGDRLGSA